MYILRKKIAQSIIEYAILISIVAVVVAGMYNYLHRAIQAKLKQIQIELSE